MSAALKVAVVQAASVAFDLERCLQKTRQLAADAARKGAKIVVFPEAFLSGYPKGSSFGAVVGSRTDAGREEYRLYWESAVDVPGPAVGLKQEVLLRAVRPLPARRIDRSVPVGLTGSMMGYTWSMPVHGVIGAPVTIARGERVELVMAN